MSAESIWEKTFPISEVFTSPQGEGLYAGQLMTFIRFAGCTVGKPFPKTRYLDEKGACVICGAEGVALFRPKDDPQNRPCCEGCCRANGWKFSESLLPIYTEMCTLYDGRTFECDTDYRVKERLTVEEILARVPDKVRTICLTGGEPMMHYLNPLVGAALHRTLAVHLETSGTVPLEKAFPCGDGVRPWTEQQTWITVSPKKGVLDDMIYRANEIKLLVNENFDVAKLPPMIWTHPLVWIQPVNFENEINRENMVRCLEVQQLYTQWRISSQSHKLWGVR
jgi:7-carboxy-7-deazaguanine synthase